jgi:hypothetical protein
MANQRPPRDLDTEVRGVELRAFDRANPKKDIWLRSSTRVDFLRWVYLRTLDGEFTEEEQDILIQSMEKHPQFRAPQGEPVSALVFAMAY